MSHRPKVLVIGGTGFLGRHVVARCRASGAEVTSTGRSRAGGADRTLELADQQATRELLREVAPDTVFLAAGAIGGPEVTMDELVTANVVHTDLLVEAVIAEAPDCSIVIASSSAVYAPAEGTLTEASPVGPVTSYGVSKAAQELVAGRASHLGAKVVLLRYFNLVGAGQPSALMLSSLTRQVAAAASEARREAVIELGRMDSRRDFVDVRDAARAADVIVRAGIDKGTYNVATGRAVSVRECLDLVAGVAGVEIRVRSGRGTMTTGDVDVQVGSFSRLHHATGWEPTFSLEDSVRALLAYWHENDRR